MLYLTSDARLAALTARVTALEAASATTFNWEGAWVIVAGQTEYLLADATVISGTATGDASADALAAIVTIDGLVQESDEYTVGPTSLTLSTSPTSEEAGTVLNLRCSRAA